MLSVVISIFKHFWVDIATKTVYYNIYEKSTKLFSALNNYNDINKIKYLKIKKIFTGSII